MTLFDSSHSGTLTAAEVAAVGVQALQVLARCTGAPVKGRDVAQAMQEEPMKLCDELYRN